MSGEATSVAVTTGAAVSAERAAQDAAPVLAAADPIDAVTAVLMARGIRAGEVTMEAVQDAVRVLYLPETVKVLGVECVRYDDPRHGAAWRGAIAQTSIKITRTDATFMPWAVHVYVGEGGARLDVALGVGSTPEAAERSAEADFRQRAIAACRASADIGIGGER